MKSLLFVVLFMSFISLNAQTLNVLSVDTDSYPLMKINFTLSDANGFIYGDLDKDDFSLKVDNIVNDDISIECDSESYGENTYIILSLDVSTSMNNSIGNNENRFDWAKYASTNFIDQVELRNDSKIYISTFSDDVKNVSGFQGNKDFLHEFIDTIKVKGGVTNYNPPFLNDGNGAISLLRNLPKESRKIVVFLSDGKPAYEFMSDQIALLANQYNIEIYTILLASPKSEELTEFSESTGGAHYSTYDKIELNDIYSNIAKRIKGENVCTIEWLQPWECSRDIVARDIDLCFKRENIIREVNYEIPEEAYVESSTDKDEIIFGTDMSIGKKELFTVKAESGECIIDDCRILPDDGAFELRLINNSFPITLKEGNSVDFEIEMTAEPQEEIYKVDFLSSPCPIKSIDIYTDCRVGALDEIDLGSRIHQSKRSFSINNVITNNNQFDISGRFIIMGKDAGKFSLGGSNYFELKPGESLDIDLDFFSDEDGIFNAGIEFQLIDACDDVVIPLLFESYKAFECNDINFGINPGCVTKDTTIIFSAPDKTSMTVEDIELYGSSASFYAVDYEKRTYLPNEKIPLKILFTPQHHGTYNTDMKINTDIGSSSIHLSGNAERAEVAIIKFEPHGSFASDNDTWQIVPGIRNSLQMNLSLPESADIEFDSIKIIIDYYEKMFLFLPEDFMISNIDDKNTNIYYPEKGKCHIVVRPVKNQNIEYNLAFLPLLADTTGSALNVSAECYGPFYCVDNTSTGRNIYMKTCNSEGRVVIVNADHKLKNIYPQPAGKYLNFDLFLGRNDNVNLKIFDSYSNIINEINYKELAPGNQQLKINTGRYCSGLFSYVLTVGGAVFKGSFIKVE